MKSKNNLILKSGFFALVLLMVSSCSLFDLDINEDPNNPATASPNLLLTSIQIGVMNNLAANEGDAETFMGLIGTQALSRYNLNNNSYTGLWDNMYIGPLKDLDGLISVSAESPHYLGIAQTLKAISYATMVDLWGDVPFSEAGLGDAITKNINPKFDKDADVYAACISLLDEAIANLAKPSPVPVTGDLIYNGSAANWLRAAKTVKLKLLMTARKGLANSTTEISNLITSGGLITEPGHDFLFRFSKDPTSIRHPWYTGAYTGGEFDYTYICHELLVETLIDEDPRWPFYFRRQTTTILDSNDPTQFNTQPCSGGQPCIYGYVVNNSNVIKRLYEDKGLNFGDAEKNFLAGVFGRDRGDEDGLPADGAFRTIPGVYPCGGYYDVATVGVPAANAAQGAGIFPFLTAVNTSYYLIEAMLELGVSGDPRAEFENAIRNHISRVVTFGLANDVNSVRPSDASITKYVDLWLSRYDAAASNTAKLNVVLKQLWFSSYGNGFEIYNAFRRTGLPSNIQEHVSGTVRGFPLRLPYPQTELTLNPNADSYKSIAFDVTPIFWDK
ncbi:MAG: SusD/RagB family nutrient-binding outer membrane lipoprotein [Saprospiraceae bacterium]|nr:SusD/RagB family nutrient-binding outer membrane lipoprotein [Saprospiraceae bacterium]